MTRQESQNLTKKIIKEAKSGKEITEAILAHFRTFKPIKVEVVNNDIELFREPLFKI